MDEKRDRYVNKTDSKDIITILHSAWELDDALYTYVSDNGNGDGIGYIYGKELEKDYVFLDRV